MKTTNDTTFEADVLAADTPVIVKFEATWCQPCKAMQPALEALEEALPAVAFYKADVELTGNFAAMHGIRQVPVLLAAKAGKIVGIKHGAAPKAQLESWIKSALGL